MDVKKCCDILFDFLKNKTGLWMWEAKEGTIFQVLSTSDIRHLEVVPYYPESVDAMATLRLLSFLAVEGDDRALEGLKYFLIHKHWGMSALAAVTLLQEGGEKEAELVRKLLKDPDRNVRAQAALALAFLGKDRSAMPILIEAYRQADYELKERILEALGQIGSEESISFLFQTLKDPFLQLRVIAASSLIQCLYR
jgi:HEAT repeat protein